MTGAHREMAAWGSARARYGRAGLLGFFCLFWAVAARAQSDCVFVRGEITTDAEGVVVDLGDAVEILAFLYLGRSAPECVDAADVNDNGIVEPSDYTYLVDFLFGSGPPPPAPFPDPGTDPTPGITVPDERDDRFSLSIGSGAGVPSNTGIEIPVRFSSAVPVNGLQVILRYNTEDAECPNLLIQEIRTEEGTLLSEASAEYIIAEFHNTEGVAFIGALADFATPFSFVDGEALALPAGDDRLLATLVVAIAACANMGPSAISFADGVEIPNDNLFPPVPLPEAHSVIVLGDEAVRPVFGEPGTIEIRRGFIRGDANKDDGIDIADPVFMLSYIFQGGSAPPCMDSADVNNDTRVDISDPIFLLSFLFQGGPQPSEPFPQAGVDPSDDGRGSLGCESDEGAG